MEQKRNAIVALIGEGNNFTYENFALRSQHGFPNALKPEWAAWTARVSSVTKRLFGEDSAPYRLVVRADHSRLVGYGREKFENALNHYLAALKLALDVLDADHFGEAKSIVEAGHPVEYSNRVFIVHGHDEIAKNELEILLAEMGFEPVVLHRQADKGQTIIEKFEENADVGYAFILLTPDDIAYSAKEEQLNDGDRHKEFRARPNVIFEFGYFIGRLGRNRTCCLYKGTVALPSDVSGLIYKRFERSIEEVAYAVRKELKAAGYSPN